MNVKDGYKQLGTAIVHSLTFSGGKLSWKKSDDGNSSSDAVVGIVGTSPGFTPATSTVTSTAAKSSQYVLTADKDGTPTWNALPDNAFKNDNTTYSVVSSSVNGLAPKTGTAAAATISSQSTEWVLTTTSGAAPTWRALPSTAFSDTKYSASTGLSLSGTTFSLAKATTSTIGGVKVSTVNTSTVSPTTATGTNYSLAVDSNGLLYVTIPTTSIIAGTSSTAAANGSVTANGSTSTVYINTVEGSSAKGSISIKGGGLTTVSAASGAITISTSNKTLTIKTSSTASTTYNGTADATVDLYSLIASNSVQFLGGVASTDDIIGKTTAGYGDYVRATSAITIGSTTAHAGDVIMLNSSDSGAYATIGNWVVLHTEIDTNIMTTTGSTLKADTNLYLLGGTGSSSTSYQTTYLSGAGAYINNGYVYSGSSKTLTEATKLFKLNGTETAASTSTSIYAPTAGGAAGTILIGQGTTSAPAWLSAGSSGYVLRSNGAAKPSWVSVTSLLSYYYVPTSVSASSLALSSGAWAQVGTALTITAGSTYAIRIAVTANNIVSYASGIFTASTDDLASDEIPLHCSIPSGGYRIYAKTTVSDSKTYIHLAADSSVTASVTIHYKKLI